jgi:hypothetical protein
MIKDKFIEIATKVQNSIVSALETCIRAVKWFF